MSNDQIMLYLISGQVWTLFVLYAGTTRKELAGFNEYPFAGAMAAMMAACALFVLTWPVVMGWIVAKALIRGLRA